MSEPSSDSPLRASPAASRRPSSIRSSRRSIVIAAVLLGAAAIMLLPREEEPQIKVPMVDVMVSMPGSSAKEIEERATRPMEKLLWEMPGVEYIYSTSRDSESLVIVRFKVGEDPERSLVKLTEKLRSNFDRIPMGVTPPLIKPKSIDDVPILALTFHSTRYDHLTLRRLAAQVEESVKQVPLVAETTLLGGSRRTVRVLLDPVKLASRNLSPGRPGADAPAGEPPVPRRWSDHRQPGGAGRNRRVSRRPRRMSAMSSSACSAGVRSICAKSRRSSMAARNPRSMCSMERRRRGTRRHPEHRQTSRGQCHLRGRRGAAQGGVCSKARSFPPMSR